MPWDVPLRGMGSVFGYTQPGPVIDNDSLTNAVQPMTNQVMAMRSRGITGRVADALLPRTNEQGMPQAPGVGDFINAALWALPGARGPRAAMAAEGRLGLKKTNYGYDIVNGDKKLAETQLDFSDPKKPFIKYIGDPSRPSAEAANQFSTGQLRDILRQFKELHPEAETLGGLHTSEGSVAANRGVQDMQVRLPGAPREMPKVYQPTEREAARSAGFERLMREMRGE